MGGTRSLNEALKHALKPETAKAAAGPPARLQKVRTVAPMGALLPGNKRYRTGSVGTSTTSEDKKKT
jgi:hypothetical protein